MTTQEALAYFDGNRTALARALGVRPPSLYDWGQHPPPLRQLQLERVTLGKLRADPSCDAYRVEVA